MTLIQIGAKVIGLDVRTNRKSNLLKESDYKKITLIKGSVSNFKLVKSILNTYKPEVIFHFGAEAIVGVCNKEPVRAYKNNIEGTWNVLEASRLSPWVKAIVVASSDKAYGSH
ncbi:MAG: GDP-mannose 4,6-dehydratase [Endomicrobiales bacterium]